jgi:hypothetical protein
VGDGAVPLEPEVRAAGAGEPDLERPEVKVLDDRRVRHLERDGSFDEMTGICR